jgi:hypothetical protein
MPGFVFCALAAGVGLRYYLFMNKRRLSSTRMIAAIPAMAA